MRRHALRLALLVGLVVLAADVSPSAPIATAAVSPRSISAVQALEPAILSELNAVRRAHGLRPLRRSAPLAAAATTHSRAMAAYGFFRHDSRDGSAFWRRVVQFYGKGGYKNWAVGENLLWSTELDAAAAVRLWLSSPPHRRNILDPRWREVGLSAVSATRAPGHFGGRDVVIVTSNFGVRG